MVASIFPELSRMSLDPALITLAHDMADAAGTVIRRYFRTPVGVDTKSDESPVTIADRETEAAMRALLAQRRPQDGILGEEHGRERLDAEYLWVIDPIDGTRAFITGMPLFGVLIGLMHRGKPVLGIIDQPILRERWLGVAGQPTTMNGKTIKTRPCPSLDKAFLYSTAPDMFKGADAVAYERVRSKVRQPRFGGDCYAYGLLTMGFADLVIEASLQPYDYCAVIPVVEGAGGVMSDWQGKALTIESDGRVVAAGDRAAHEAALKALAG
jgi:inositol-phosphate phosphatase/L-galactose 1-phosphate phosphatase/histidinol-phosphatase